MHRSKPNKVRDRRTGYNGLLVSAMRIADRLWFLRTVKKHFELAATRLKVSFLFDEQWYLQNYPEVAGGGMSPLKHYVFEGARRGLSPHRLFDPEHYSSQFMVKRLHVNPLLHYHLIGSRKGKSPTPWFDNDFYLEANHDVAMSKMNGYEHYVRHGVFENRVASANFESTTYLNHYNCLLYTSPSPRDA